MLTAVTSTLLLRQAQCNSLPKVCAAVLTARPQHRCSSSECGSDDQPKEEPKRSVKAPPAPKKEKPPSMWEKPDCCEKLANCPMRYDVLYLKEQPKKYTRTWVECTEFEKMVYECSGEIEPPEIMHRPLAACMTKGDPERCPICVGDENKLGLMKCKKAPKLDGPCVKIRMPCCKEVRDPPTCSAKAAIHECCQKRCTQYPAYSECKRERPPVGRPIECLCLRVPSMCEVYEQFRKLAMK